MKVKDTNMEENVYRWEDYVPGMKLKTNRALVKIKPRDGYKDNFWRAVYWNSLEHMWMDHGYYPEVYEEEDIEKIMFVD